MAELIAKYFDSSSARYVFKKHAFEQKIRDRRGTLPFHMSVGGKKMKYLEHFFTDDDKLKTSMDKKNFKQLDQLLDQIADFSLC